MGINWKHRKVIVSIVMCVLLCVTAITAMMYTAFGAGSSNIKNVNAIQVYSNDKAGSADTSEGTDTTGNMDKAGSTDTKEMRIHQVLVNWRHQITCLRDIAHFMIM